MHAPACGLLNLMAAFWGLKVPTAGGRCVSLLWTCTCFGGKWTSVLAGTLLLKCRRMVVLLHGSSARWQI